MMRDELRGVATRAPVRVVEVLPPPGVVGADGLQVAVGERRDPDIVHAGGITRSTQRCRSSGPSRLPFSSRKVKPGAGSAARPALLVRGGTAKARHARTLAAKW